MPQGEKITLDRDLRPVSAGVASDNSEYVIQLRLDPVTKRLLVNTQSSTDVSEYIKYDLMNTGSNVLAVDGSSTPVIFNYVVPENKSFYLYRSTFIIEDGSVDFVPANFGAITGSLSNGVIFGIKKNNGTETTVATFKSNKDFRKNFYDFEQEFRVAGAYAGRWTHTKDTGSPILLNSGDSIQIKIQDNLSTIDTFEWTIAGKLV